MEKNVISYLGLRPVSAQASLANCGGCSQKTANCSGSKVGNCGGCVANASGDLSPETLANEAKAMGMTVEQYQKYLEAKGETKKASTLSTWIKDGTLSNVLNQGVSIFKSFSGFFSKSSDPAEAANPTAAAAAKEEDKSAALWNGLPVWGWIVLGIIVVPILVYLGKLLIGKSS